MGAARHSACPPALRTRSGAFAAQLARQSPPPFSTEVLRGLVRRGLSGVKLVISAAHEGIKVATSRVLAKTWQCCRVHFQRGDLAHAGKSSQRVVSTFVAAAFAQPNYAAASAHRRLVANQIRPKLPNLAMLMDGAEEECEAPSRSGASATAEPCMIFPTQHRAKLHRTNPAERLNAEIKRRLDAVGVQACPGTGGGQPSLPQRGSHHAPRRWDPDGADRGMGCPTIMPQDLGNPAPVGDDVPVGLPAAQTD